jgi:hypothetical protein
MNVYMLFTFDIIDVGSFMPYGPVSAPLVAEPALVLESS